MPLNSSQQARPGTAKLGKTHLTNTSAATLIACHDCDLLYRVKPLQPGDKARCSRCGAVLYREKRDSLERTLALTVAGLILFILANAYPLLRFELQGQVQVNHLITGVIDLYRDGFWGLAFVVFAVSIFLPLLELVGTIYILLPLKLGRRPWKMVTAFRLLEGLHSWAMTEVYMLGVLVAIVKLSGMATIVIGTALYAFSALILVIAASETTFDPRIVWESLEQRP